MVRLLLLIGLLLMTLPGLLSGAQETRPYYERPEISTLPDNARFLIYAPNEPVKDMNITGSILKLFFLDRGNHSGSQAISTITGLQSALDAKANSDSLAAVATSGSYTDLQNQPSIPPAQVNSDWTAASGVAQILNKPTIPSDATQIAYSNLAYPALTTVDAAINYVLYVAPSITAHTNRITYGTVSPFNQSVSGTAATNTIEIGNTVSRVELFWTLNKTVTTQSIAYTGGSIGSVSADVRTYDHTGQSFTTSRTYTLTVGDGTNTDNTPTTAVSISHKRYWGVSSNTSLTDLQIIALSSEFSSSRAQTRNGMVASGQYIYFAYPDSWGAATFTVNGLPSTAWTLVQRTFVNASGNGTIFRIYRSDNLLTGTYNVVVS